MTAIAAGGAETLEAAAITCQALDAEAFLDIANYEVDPERELRSAIEAFLDTRSRSDT